MREIGKNRVISDKTKEKIKSSKTGIISTKRMEVCQIDLDGNLIKIWDFAGEAESILKIPKGKISTVCLGQRKTTGGFKWKYKNELD